MRTQYARIRGRRSPKKASVVAEHPILVVACQVLGHNRPYEELGEYYFHKCRSGEAYARRLVRQLERLGYEVALEPLVRAA